MNQYNVTVGAVEITAVSDGELFFDRDGLFPAVPSASWEPYMDELTADGRVMLNIGSFVLRSEGRTVLIDTGLGPSTTGLDANCGHLLDELALKAAPPEEVDLVVMTHIHPDHIGWNLLYDDSGAKLAFPKARYLVPKEDWLANEQGVEQRTATAGQQEGVNRRAEAFKRQVLPLEGSGRLDLYEGEHPITNAITTLPTPGHTPGHMCIMIASQGERAVILGDVAHVPLEVHETSWTTRVDMDPEQAVSTRRAVLDQIETDDALLLAGHFPAPGFGRLVRLEGRRYWQAL